MMIGKRIKAGVLIVGMLLISAWVVNDKAVAHEGHKHRHAPASARKLKNPMAPTDDNIAAGRELFSQNCARCHGEDGKSETEVAKAMKVKPTDLTAKEMHGITDGEIFWVISNGIKPSGMPKFDSKTSADQRWKMVVYVKHLMGEHPHGPAH